MTRLGSHLERDNCLGIFVGNDGVQTGVSHCCLQVFL
jgi:hypothetical protein